MTKYGTPEFGDTIAIVSSETSDTQIEFGPNGSDRFPVYICVAAQGLPHDGYAVGLSVEDAKAVRDELNKLIAQYDVEED